MVVERQDWELSAIDPEGHVTSLKPHFLPHFFYFFP
jgi:hypothetical protein